MSKRWGRACLLAAAFTAINWFVGALVGQK